MINDYTPIASVVTPVYNGSTTLSRCIESVQRQSFLHIEHILVDDGSSDESFEMLSEAAEKYPNVRIYAIENSGAGIARNYAVQRSRGRFIAFLDCDDEWSPRKLEIQIRYMIENNVCFSYTNYRMNYKNNRRQIAITCPSTVRHRDFIVLCPILCSSVVYDSKLLGKQYMHDIRRGQDWGLWLQISSLGVVAFNVADEDAYTTYHVSTDSLSSHKLKKIVNVYSIYRLSGYALISSVILVVLHMFGYAIKLAKRHF